MIVRLAGLFVFVACLALPGSAKAQAPAPAPAPPKPAEQPAPPIRRWLDVQTLQMGSRFRWIESSRGDITSSTHQWQPQLRARLLFDRAARYSLNIGAFGGAHLVSGWNNTGGGIGDFTHDFNVKQLFLSAEPLKGLELQVGGLYVLRGENTEITAYDNDVYIVGERATFRPLKGRVAQVSATVAYFGDTRKPNLFDRFHRINEINYGQLLVAARLHPRVNVSADYTYEDGRDILREAATIRLPSRLRYLTALNLDFYQRIAPNRDQGFNASADLRLTSRLTVTGGVAHVDRNYLVPGYISPNSDRFERGTRFYSIGSYRLTPDLSVGWFHGEAFHTNFPIPNEHRFDIMATFNPLGRLKAKRVF
jgi:hypothetical protein